MTEPADRPPLPDRLAVNAKSRFYNAAILEHDIGIRINGNERNDVEEYCISEGWIKVAAGKKVDRFGDPLLILIRGKVEAFYK